MLPHLPSEAHEWGERHELVKTSQVQFGDDTIVGSSTQSLQLPQLTAKQIDSLFAKLFQDEDREDERPETDSIENLDYALPTMTNSIGQ